MAKSNMDQDILKVLFSEQEIHDRIQEMGNQLYDEFHDRNPLFVGVLNGCFLFMADLVRATQCKSEVEFIGLPGDTVSFSGGYVYINGQRLEEEYLDQQGGTISPNQTSFTVPEGCLFFLGDNRSGSNDARYWEESYIPVGNVKAHVLLAISLTGGSSWQGVRAIG